MLWRPGRYFRKRRSRWKGHLLSFLIVSTGLATAATQIDAKAVLTPVEIPRPEPRWVDIERPVEVFGLSSLVHDPASFRYRAERYAGADGRRDVLSYGEARGEAAYLAIAVHRAASGEPDLAMVAARLAGMPSNPPSIPIPLRTKFGAMHTTDATIDGRSCLVFARFEEPSATAIEGVMCAPTGYVVDRRSLTCAIDRLDLVGGSQDDGLRRYFAQAELRRDFCGAGVISGNSNRRFWYDASAARPELRN